MNICKLCFVVGLFCSTILTSYGLNILVAKSGGTKSHNNFFEGIVDALMKDNHTITFISGFALPERANLKQAIVGTNHMEKLFGNPLNVTMMTLMQNFMTLGPIQCNDNLGNEKVQNLLNDKFDIVLLSLYFSDCFLSVAHKQKIPFIYVSVNVMLYPYNLKVGALEFNSVTPNKLLPFSHPLPFLGRLLSTLHDTLLGEMMVNAPFLRRMTEVCQERNLCSSELKLHEFDKNASLVFINNVRELEVPIKTTVPALAYIGGIHIKETNELPEDLQKVFDKSGDHGVIYFSLGTSTMSKDLKKGHLEILLNVFGSLKQQVIWKFELETLDNLPSNVKINKWLPQQDILAHPKTKLFISHGGHFSTQEATYFEVPVVGIPGAIDQKNNIAGAVAEGWALKVDWSELTEQNLNDTIQRALFDNSLRRAVKNRSNIMRDQPMSPADLVRYWVKYVVRHKGAAHLRSPFINLPGYKLLNVDVWALIISTVTIIFAIIYQICKYIIVKIFCTVFRKKSKVE